KSRTGVLLYVSLAECYAEIIADSAIDAKVEKGTWQSLMNVLTQTIAKGNLTEGLLCTIDDIGRYLETHFPPGSFDPNELPNHLIILKTI
ncbi:MAG: TPM domain-containing protein, partial [Hyphomicrobium sp.]